MDKRSLKPTDAEMFITTSGYKNPKNPILTFISYFIQVLVTLGTISLSWIVDASLPVGVGVPAH